MNQFFEDVDKLFVINLVHDLNRKKHVIKQFRKIAFDLLKYQILNL